MYAELTHVIALVTHGNLFLRTSGAAPEGAEPYASKIIFEAASTLRFVTDGRAVAASTTGWFEYCRATGTQRLQFVLGPFPAYVRAAFADRREWGIEATYSPESSIWKAHWQTDQQRPPRWHVTYSELRLAAPLDAPTDLQNAATHLRSAIEAAEPFARRAGRGDFAGRLADAMNANDGPRAEPAWFSRILPSARANPEAARLLALADRAFVFGGMGSWNDVGFLDSSLQQEHNSVTDSLWRALLVAVATATNVFVEPVA